MTRWAVAFWLPAAAAAAQTGAPPEPPTALLIAGPHRSPVLPARVVGQTADLPWRLSVDEAPLADPGGEDAPLEALARGARRGARVVLWWVPRTAGPGSPARLELHAVEVPSGRVTVRRIDARPGLGGASATAEAAALVVRGLLTSLAEEAPEAEAASPTGPPAAGMGSPPPGGDEGVRRRAPSDGPTDASEQRRREPDPGGRPGPQLRFRGGAGVELLWDGASQPLVPALAVGAGLDLGELGFGLGATVGAERPLRRLGALGGRRSTLVATARAPLLAGGGSPGTTAWTLLLAGRGGLVVYGIGPARPEELTGPARRRSLGPLIGGTLSFRLRMTPALDLVGSAGADLVPERPAPDLTEDGVTRRAASFWVVQPRIGLSLDVLLPSR